MTCSGARGNPLYQWRMADGGGRKPAPDARPAGNCQLPTGGLLAKQVPRMRLPRRPDSQGVDGGVSAAEQRLQVGAAEGEVHRLLREADDADALPGRLEHPDASR